MRKLSTLTLVLVTLILMPVMSVAQEVATPATDTISAAPSLLERVWMFMKSDAGAAMLAAALLFSEALASIKSVQANSIFQLIYGILKRLVKKPEPTPPTM